MEATPGYEICVYFAICSVQLVPCSCGLRQEQSSKACSCARMSQATHAGWQVISAEHPLKMSGQVGQADSAVPVKMMGLGQATPFSR